MAAQYRCVFLDLDGTLLTPKASVSKRNEACIRSLVARGIHVVFATGRPIESVRVLLGPIHATDPAITLSGSMVHRSLFSEPLFESHIPFETMHSVLADCQRLTGIENILLDESEGFFALRDNPVLDEFIGMYGRAPALFTFDSIPPSPVLSIMIHAKKERQDIYSFLQERYADRLHFTYFREYPWIELSLINTNKGNALELVCDHLKLRKEEVIAIGDGANDLEMIAQAGLGIAMENGDEEVRLIADMIAPHHAQDGVAIVLEEIFDLSGQ